MIISFDVGIKNMAYCLINDTRDIIKWNVLDLGEPSHSCSQCTQNSKYEDKEKNIFYCGRHIKKSKKLKMPISYKKISKLSIKKLKEFCIEENIDSTGTKQEIQDYIETYKVKHFLFDIIKVSCKDVDMVDIGIRLKEKLDEDIKNEDIDCILIENQIGTIAIRMKTIQGMLAQYFIMNGKTNISFISSTNKLKDFSLKKLSYKERKQKSIEITKEQINTEWREYFINHKKKDDLADSFLQLLWYLNNASCTT